MQKIAITIILLQCMTTMSAMEHQQGIIVPARTIHKRLCEDLHLNIFVARSNIHKKLGDYPFYPIGFVAGVDNEIFEFNQDLQTRSSNIDFIQQSSRFMWKMRDPIIRAILEDYQNTIEQLTREYYLEELPEKGHRNILWDVFIKNK